MTIRILTLMLTCLSVVSAAEPFYQGSCPDLARTRARFEASVYKASYDALPDAIRTQLLEQINTAKAEAGLPADLDLWQLAACLTDAAFRIDQLPDGKGNWTSGAFRMRIGLSDNALMQRLLASLDGLQKIDANQGSLASWRIEDLRIDLHEDHLDLGLHEISGSLSTPEASAADEILIVDFEQLRPLISEGLLRNPNPPLARILEDLGRLPVLAAEFGILPHGLREDYNIDRIVPGLAPVDQALLERMPADCLYLLALGIDARAFWDKAGTGIIEAVALADHRSPEQVRQELDTTIARTGVATNFDEFIDGLKGSAVIAVRPGAPFPTASLFLPRNPVLDRCYALLLSQTGQTLPADGSSMPLQLPRPLPLPITICAEAQHVMISSDLMLPSQWLQGSSGGWLASETAQRIFAEGKEPLLLEATDTASILTVLKGWLPMMLASNPMFQRELGPQGMPMVMKLIDTISAQAKPSFVVVNIDNEQTRVQAETLLGSVNIFGILAATTVPAISNARKTAQRTATTNTMKQLMYTAVSFRADNGRYPYSLDELAREMDLAPKSLQSPSAPDDPAPFRYVRPKPSAGSRQPFLVTNPDHYQDGRTPAVFCDGHVETVDARSAYVLWSAAELLAAKNGNTDHPGASLDDWTAAGYTLNR